MKQDPKSPELSQTIRVKMPTSVKLILINVGLILTIGLITEVGARLIYPEFQGHVHSLSQTLGIWHHTASLAGLPIRVPFPDYEYPRDKPVLVVLGDSVSNGYGSAFEDIYWVKLLRLLNNSQSSNINVLSISGYGDNLSNSVSGIETLYSSGTLKIRGILYQFNQNDVTPYDREGLKRTGDESIVRWKFFKKLAAWRYEYLNRSVFVRVVSHYAGVFSRRITGTCEERGLDALGPYTWTFGSRRFRAESEQYWKEFAEKLSDLKQLASQIEVPLWIFVSPLVF